MNDMAGKSNKMDFSTNVDEQVKEKTASTTENKDAAPLKEGKSVEEREGTSRVKFKKPIAPTIRHTAGKLLKHKSETLLENVETEPDEPIRKEQEKEGVAVAEGEDIEIRKCETRGKEPPLSYVEPPWSGIPGPGYSMEVLKSGVIIDRLSLEEKSFYLIGRLPSCHLSLAHPTISRHHAILQYRSIPDKDHSLGFYIYDLESTHGTFWNGSRIKPNLYVRVQGGHMLKFGCSQRKYILQAPTEDQEEESEYTITQLKERRQLELQNRLVEEQAAFEEKQSEGVDWGMGEDADEATDLQENPYASINDEDLVLDDPKKTLRGWFEREGYDLEYHCEEKGIGQFLCWVNLPLENITGRAVRAEALVKGKKKESVVQCALEACKILDKYGLLRQANHEARKRKVRNWEEEDFYDSDEDNFLDRTGSVEKKREQRMRLAGKLETKVETHDSLLEKQREIVERITYLSNSLDNSQTEGGKQNETSAEADALDAYMSKLTSCALSKSDVAKMKLELQTLEKEKDKLLKLLDLTRPANLPPLSRGPTTSAVLSEPSSRTKPCAKKSQAPFGLRVPSKQKANHDEQDEQVEQEEEKEKQEQKNHPRQEGKEEEEMQIETDEEHVSAGFSDASKRVPRLLRTNRQSSEEMVDGKSDDFKVDTEKSEKRSPKKMMGQSQKRGGKTSDQLLHADKYSTWIPPHDQQGDGRTKLNDKYGY